MQAPISTHGRRSPSPPGRPARRSSPGPTSWLAVVAVIALLAACAGGAAGDGVPDAGAADGEGEALGAPEESTEDLDELIFLTVVPPESLTFAPELLALAAGYFAEEGLDVRLQPARGSPQAIQGVLSELALLSRVGDFEVMQAVGERGAEELVNLGMVLRESSIRLMSTPENPVTSAEDLTTGLVGIPSEGGNSEVTIDLVGLAGGVDDLDKQVVGLSPGTYDLVEDERLISYAVSLDTAILLEQTRDAVSFNPGEVIDAGGQVYLGNRVALEDEAARAQVEGFFRAVLRAMQDIIEDEGDDFAAVLATMREDFEFDSLMDDDVATAALREYVRSWTLDGEENLLRTDEERWQNVYDEIVETGAMPGGLDPSEWFTNDLVPD